MTRINSKIFFRGFLVLFIGYAELSFANYRTAQAQLNRRNYMAAAPEFYKAYIGAANRSERANAEFGLARSLEGVGLNYSASKFYSGIVQKGPSNPFFSKAFEALGRIDERVNLGRSHFVRLFRREIRQN